MKKCPFCGADIEDNARFCLYCMQSLTEKEQILLHKKKLPQWLLVIAAIVVILLTLIVIGFLRQSPQEATPPFVDTQPSETTSVQAEPTDTQPVTEPVHIHNYSIENISSEYQEQAATCTSLAVYYYSCLCGEKGTGTFSHGELAEHNIVTTPGQPADCVHTGLTDGSHCAVCKTVFLAQTPTPVISHTFDNDQDESCNVCNFIRVLNCRHSKIDILPAVAPTCTGSGLTEGKTCALCQEILTPQSSLAPLGHNEIIDQAIAATCTTNGKTEGKHCATCHTILSPQITLFAKGHTEVIDQAIAATCTTDGKTEGKHCSVCDAVLSPRVTIFAKGHTEVLDQAITVTCTTDGKTEGKHCSVCETIIQAQTTIHAPGHSYNTEDPTAPCSRCGAQPPHIHSYTEENTSDQYLRTAATCTSQASYYYSCLCGEKSDTFFRAGHANGHSIVTVPGYPPTCISTGRYTYEYCSVCKDTFGHTGELPRIGHTFDVENSPSACIVCGVKETLTIVAPQLPIVVNSDIYHKPFRIDRITYTIEKLSDGNFVIDFTFYGTNISSENTLFSIDASLYGPNNTALSCSLSGNLAPDQSGTYLAGAQICDSSGTYTLVFD